MHQPISTLAAIDAAPPRIGADWFAQGGTYAGIARGRDGAPDHHLILLPGEAKSLSWKKATAWAEEAGGTLPSRSEQALLYANLKDQFEPDWYWSGEQHASDSGYAWFQYFCYGYQNSTITNHELRARAVRRLAIQ